MLCGLGLDYELLLVNDASPDDSLVRLKENAARRNRVTILQLPRNRGQQVAVLIGLSYARGQLCAIMDGDLQDRPSSLAVLWHARSPQVSAIFGGRRGRYESTGRHLTSRLFKWAMHQMAGLPVDAGMFVLMERPLVDALLSFPTRVPWLPAMIGCLKVPVLSIPIARDRRSEGTSAYRPMGRLLAAVRGFYCVLEHHFWPPKTSYLDWSKVQFEVRLIAAAGLGTADRFAREPRCLLPSEPGGNSP